MPPKISLEDFKSLCKEKYRYTGYVEGLGQVYWVPRHVRLPMSDMPSQTPYNTPHGSRFTTTIYEMKVVKEEKNENTGDEALERIAEIGADVLSIYGMVTSIESMSTKPVIFGPKYNRVNWQGTVVRNHNRKRTTWGKVASGIGNKVFVAGIIVDWSLVAMGKQNWRKAVCNTAMNTGIWAIGSKCPPLAVVWVSHGLSCRSLHIVPALEYTNTKIYTVLCL